MPDSPQEVRDKQAQEDTAQVPEPEAFANVGASIGRRQTTQHEPSLKSSLGIGCASREELASVTHGFSLSLPLTQTTSMPSTESPKHLGIDRTLSDPSHMSNFCKAFESVCHIKLITKLKQ